jgi:hypothetical protein
MDLPPHLPLPEGFSVPVGRSSRTAPGGVMVVPPAPKTGSRLRLPLPRSPQGVVAADMLRTTVCYEQTSKVALHSRCHKTVAGYVAKLGNTAVGPGHGCWGGRETWGAKLIQAAAELRLSCIMAGETCRFFVVYPCRIPWLVKLASNQREMALVWVGAKLHLSVCLSCCAVAFECRASPSVQIMLTDKQRYQHVTVDIDKLGPGDDRSLQLSRMPKPHGNGAACIFDGLCFGVRA